MLTGYFPGEPMPQMLILGMCPQCCISSQGNLALMVKWCLHRLEIALNFICPPGKFQLTNNTVCIQLQKKCSCCRLDGKALVVIMFLWYDILFNMLDKQNHCHHRTSSSAWWLSANTTQTFESIKFTNNQHCYLIFWCLPFCHSAGFAYLHTGILRSCFLKSLGNLFS